MREYIHDKTIEKFFEEHFDEVVVDRRFENRQTKEIYHVLTGNETDIAFFTIGKEGNHICLNSDGEPVEPQQIFGYINGEYVSEFCSYHLYKTDKLKLQYRGNGISMRSIVESEKDLYPERTSIIIPAILERKASHGEDIRDFLVDKVVKGLAMKNSAKLSVEWLLIVFVNIIKIIISISRGRIMVWCFSTNKEMAYW